MLSCNKYFCWFVIITNDYFLTDSEFRSKIKELRENVKPSIIPIFRTLSSQTSKETDSIDQSRRSPIRLPRSQGVREMCRDVLGCFLVMIASCVVYFTDSQIAKYVDPLFAMFSAISLFVLSYPYSKYYHIVAIRIKKKYYIPTKFEISFSSERIRHDTAADHTESHKHRFAAKRAASRFSRYRERA